jgi:hypothetical protein
MLQVGKLAQLAFPPVCVSVVEYINVFMKVVERYHLVRLMIFQISL